MFWARSISRRGLRGKMGAPGKRGSLEKWVSGCQTDYTWDITKYELRIFFVSFLYVCLKTRMTKTNLWTLFKSCWPLVALTNLDWSNDSNLKNLKIQISSFLHALVLQPTPSQDSCRCEYTPIFIRYISSKFISHRSFFQRALPYHLDRQSWFAFMNT